MIRWAGGRMRRGPAIALITAAVVITGSVASAVTLTDGSQDHKAASLRRLSQVVSVTSPFKAVANVMPPVAASTCKRPTAFTYSGTLSVIAVETVRYQWVYSSGKPGPVRTVRFTTAGAKEVTGATIRATQGGGGWGEIRIISPIARTSKKAAYKLVCSGSVDGITATAAVRPAARTMNCASARPAFTATGAITAPTAETVTYYWAQSAGAKSAPATLTFTKPGTQPVKPLTISPPGASGTGDAVLVVTSPVTVASGPATYTLTCTGSTPSQPGPVAGVNPPPTTAIGTGGNSPPPLPPDLVVTVNAAATAYLGVPYSGTVTVTGGEGPYHWGATSGLPSGLTATANGATLTISGTPHYVDTSWVPGGSVSDSYQLQQTAYWEVRITVNYAPVTISCPAGQATVGQPYVGTMTATGGDGTFRWSVIGIPPGLAGTANGATFNISGTPADSDVITTTSPPTPGRYQLDVTIFDSQTSFGRMCDFLVNP